MGKRGLGGLCGTDIGHSLFLSVVIREGRLACLCGRSQSQAVNCREEEAEVGALCALSTFVSIWLGKVLPFPPNLTREGLGSWSWLCSCPTLHSTQVRTSSAPHRKTWNISFNDRYWLGERLSWASPCCEVHLAVNL